MWCNIPCLFHAAFKDALRKLERAASRQRTQAQHFERPPTCVEPDGFLYDSSGSRTSIPTPVVRVLYISIRPNMKLIW